jgi:hypothetical protein
MSVIVSGLLFGSAGAHADPIQFDFSGIVSSVFAPSPLPSPFTSNPFAVGQSVFGSADIPDLTDATLFPLGPTGNVYVFQGPLSNPSAVPTFDYQLSMGPIQFHPATEEGNIFIVNGASGSADELLLDDEVPLSSFDPPTRLAFDDLEIALFDPTGTAFTSPDAPIDFSKFVVGSVGASGDQGFSEIGISAIVAVHEEPRSVPEPDTLLLLLTGMLGMGATMLPKSSITSRLRASVSTA